MKLYLGVDGGGTGCRVALADDTGRILARAEAGPANIFSNRDLALKNILAATTEAAVQAFGADGSKALPRIHAGLGLAGANAAGATEWLQSHLPFAQSRIETDAVTAVKGALGAEDGIVAAIGTGSVFAIQQAGHVRQIGGWGLALGDEGSGALLGRSLLARALRAHDGVYEMTPLLQSVLTHFETTEQLVAFSLTAKPSDYAVWAPQLLESHDPAAQALLDHATQEVTASILALQTTPALPVVFIGGLGPAYAARIDHWKKIPAKGSSLDGALMLAMEAGR